MWLINTTTHHLEKFAGDQVPKYAILSHTWGEEAQEVTFQEWRLMTEDTKLKKGFAKIMSACAMALKDSLGYLWVDTNCIDKSSSAELSEAINSMFAWYHNSTVCYVYLADVEDPDRVAAAFLGAKQSLDDSDYNNEISKHNIREPAIGEAEERLMAEFRTSRWFTRGWTLQELLAPRDIRFFTNAWEPIGRLEGYLTVDSRTSVPPRFEYLPLFQLVSEITGIALAVLVDPTPMSSCSIGEKMSWMAKRKTTREEDMAYCMMGIFDINMPLLYGEGGKAFQRLQEAIISQSVDNSLFAWQWPWNVDTLTTHKERSYPNIFASSPSCFSTFPGSSILSDDVFRSDLSPIDSIITLTNFGVSLSMELIHTGNAQFLLGALNVRLDKYSLSAHALDRELLCIGLRKDGQFYYRAEFPPAPIAVRIRRKRLLQLIHIPRGVNTIPHVSWNYEFAFILLFHDPKLIGSDQGGVRSFAVSTGMQFRPALGTVFVMPGALEAEPVSYAILGIGPSKNSLYFRICIRIRKGKEGVESSVKLFPPDVPLDTIHQTQMEFRGSGCYYDDKFSTWSVVVGWGQKIPNTGMSDPAECHTTFTISLYDDGMGELQE